MFEIKDESPLDRLSDWLIIKHTMKFLLSLGILELVILGLGIRALIT